MHVTPEGIVMEVRLEQYQKAELLMVDTPLGIVKEVKPEQNAYL